MLLSNRSKTAGRNFDPAAGQPVGEAGSRARPRWPGGGVQRKAAGVEMFVQMLKRNILGSPTWVWLCLLVIFLGLVVNHSISIPPQSKYWNIGTAETPGVVEETLLLTVNSSEAALTSQRYVGAVTITIRGEGRIDENTGYDAFSTYSIADNKALGYFRGFRIDDRDLILMLGWFAYKPNHEYSFLFRVGDEPRYISFRIINEEDKENSGQFSVEVSTLDKVSSGGR
jgi:hypothetical protein